MAIEFMHMIWDLRTLARESSLGSLYDRKQKHQIFGHSIIWTQCDITSCNVLYDRPQARVFGRGIKVRRIGLDFTICISDSESIDEVDTMRKKLLDVVAYVMKDYDSVIYFPQQLSYIGKVE